MPTYSDAPPFYNYEGIVKELDRNLSRKTITIASGVGILPPMTVLGKVTATGKYKQVNLAASDGTENAAAILLEGVDATSADVTGQSIVRLATVNMAELNYPSGATSGNKTTINTALDALMIVVLAGA